MIGTTFDSVTTALAAKCITHAENEINKYISKRYDIVAIQASVPPLLTSLCEDISTGYMYQKMGRGGKEAMERGKMFIDPALENLKDIRDYKMDLVDSTGSVIADFSNTAYRILSNTSNYAPTFNEDGELNWKVDEDKLDDISGERD